MTGVVSEEAHPSVIKSLGLLGLGRRRLTRVPTDGEALRAAMALTAEYLPTETTQHNPSDHTPALSRRARGVDVWAVLRQLGRSGWIWSSAAVGTPAASRPRWATRAARS